MRNIHNGRASGGPGPESDVLLQADVRRFHTLLLAFGRRSPLRDPFGAVLEERELTPPQLHAMLWLGYDGALTMGDLGRRLGITEKTVTGLVDRLEKRRLVQRARDDKDRRVVHVQLTPAGRETSRHLERLSLKKVTIMLSLLDASDRRHLLRIAETLVERFTRLVDAAAAAPKQSAAAARSTGA